MGWHDGLVYYRDFAYSTPRLRMANGNIGRVPAATFAEYVDDPFLERADSDGARRRPCLAGRPALAHRLYSHRLHVRAKAKLHRDRLLSGPMVDVYVGEARRRWTLHRNLLCHHSALLEAELDGSAPRDGGDALELPAHDPAGFELLVKWLYQGALDDVSDLPDATHKYEHAVRCHALYLLCDRLAMPQLQNLAMDHFRTALNQSALVPDPDELDDMYRKSPRGSPFRRLMVRIAARQLMDPDGDRDADAYRRCFEGSPDFAVELVNAIRHGTGGLLLPDPTEKGSECEYHDHADAPGCSAKPKPRGKQARPAPPSPSPAASTRRPPPPPSQAPPQPPRPRPPPPSPPPPPRPGSSAAGPPLPRLTSPATTAGPSTAAAVASRPPTPEATEDCEKPKRASTPETLTAEEAEPPKPLAALAALDEPPQNYEGASRPQPPEAEAEASVVTNGPAHPSPPRRGIWEWARAGTGRLAIIGKLPHPDWNGPASASKAEGPVVHGAQENGKATESHDGLDIPSPTATEPEAAAAAKMEGLGISPFGTLMPPTDFSQTAGSSDDLIANASETTGSPSPLIMKHGTWTNGDDTTPTASKPTSPTTPDTPTPPQQRRSDSIMEIPKTREISRDTVSRTLHDNIAALTPASASTRADPGILKTASEPEAEAGETASSAPAKPNGSANSSQRRVPTYKIALASSLLSPARRSASAAH